MTKVEEELKTKIYDMVDQITDTMTVEDADDFLTGELFQLFRKHEINDFMVRPDPVDRTRMDLAIRLSEFAEFIHFPVILNSPLKENQ